MKYSTPHADALKQTKTPPSMLERIDFLFIMLPTVVYTQHSPFIQSVISRRSGGWLKVVKVGVTNCMDGTIVIPKAQCAFVPLAFLRNEIISCPSPPFSPSQSSTHSVVGDPLLDRMFKRSLYLSSLSFMLGVIFYISRWYPWLRSFMPLAAQVLFHHSYTFLHYAWLKIREK